MPKKWLQVKGDPSVREFLFQQSRKQSLFDENLDKINRLIETMLTRKGAFHVKAHYSSSQLTCWFYDDPFNYKVFVKDEVLAPDFIDSFPTLFYEGRQPCVEKHQIAMILEEFNRLRLSDDQVYLRSASINRLNGKIGMNFSCDGSHYIQHDEFFKRLREFGSVDIIEDR
ncbi:MAG: hypothetical protein P8Y20_07035 [Gammaproteobacteria bacterium]|jgi:hypothetical protein